MKGFVKKTILFSMLFACVVVLQSGCLGSDSKKDGPTSISGEAGLRVQNDFHIDQRILFNGQYIGSVSSRSSRTWSVPTGQHTVTARDSTTGDATRTYTFAAGRTTVVRVFSAAPTRGAIFVEEGLEGEQLGLPDNKQLDGSEDGK